MRNVFIDHLIERRQQNKDLFLLVGDVGYSVIERFTHLFPESYFNVGVAEQNMIGIAAGISSEGNQAYCFSIGNFTTFRCAEQIRNDVDYHNLPVCIVSVGGGVAYGNMGYSHHTIQDYALMRSMPNMLICSPVDPFETKLCLEAIDKYNGPSYLRLHRANEPLINSDSRPLNFGKPRFLGGNLNSKKAILATGYAGQLVDKDILKDYSLFSIPCWGMKFREYILPFVERFDSVVTLEDHLMDCGFGSWVLECLISSSHIAKIKVKSFNTSVIGIVGDENSIYEESGLIKSFNS